MTPGICRICGCTEDDCSQCVAKTGSPCCWVEDDLCSACSPGVELRQSLVGMVVRGECSEAEADEAFTFFDELSDRQLRGEVTVQEGLRQVVQFATNQLARRPLS